jgi:hypothetical protein
MSDKINHPRHYTAGSIEVYDFIEAWNLDFACGNVIKYVARAPYKGSHLEDLKKASWYLKKAIEKEEARIASKVANALDGKNQADASPFSITAATAHQAWIDQKNMFLRYKMDEEKRKELESKAMLGYPNGSDSLG